MVRQITNSPTRVINAQFQIGHSNWDDPDHLAVSQTSMTSLFKTVALETAGPVEPLPVSELPLDVFGLEFDDPLMVRRKIDGTVFLNRRLYNDGLLVIHQGSIIHESYRNGLVANDHHVIHSCTKSFCSMLAAQAVEEGLLDPEMLVTDYLEEFRPVNAWSGVTVQHLWDMQAGIVFDEDYSNPQSDYWRYARAAGYYPMPDGSEAIGVEAWVFANLAARDHTPGSVFVYNSSLTIVLGIILERVYGTALADLLETKLYQRVGAEDVALLNIDAQGFPIIEGQLSLTLRDFARMAYPMVNAGRNMAGDQIVPAGFIDQLLAPDSNGSQAYHRQHRDDVFPSGRYKNHFWIVAPHRRQLSMIGIHGQFAWCDPDNDLLVVGLGSYPKQDGTLMVSVLKDLWEKLSQQVSKR